MEVTMNAIRVITFFSIIFFTSQALCMTQEKQAPAPAAPEANTETKTVSGYTKFVQEVLKEENKESCCKRRKIRAIYLGNYLVGPDNSHIIDFSVDLKCETVRDKNKTDLEYGTVRDDRIILQNFFRINPELGHKYRTNQANNAEWFALKEFIYYYICCDDCSHIGDAPTSELIKIKS